MSPALGHRRAGPRPRRRWPLLLVLFLLVTGCADHHRFPIRYEDRPGQHKYPLTATSVYGASVVVKSPGMPYTASVIVSETGRDTAHLIKVEPIAHSANLEVIGTSAAGPHRHFGQAIGSHGYPPADLPKPARTGYRPIDEVPVRPDDPKRPLGVDVLMGVRYQTGTRAWFDGIRVTYRVGNQTYIGDFPVSWAMCDEQPCEMPDYGSPWGPA